MSVEIDLESTAHLLQTGDELSEQCAPHRGANLGHQAWIGSGHASGIAYFGPKPSP